MTTSEDKPGLARLVNGSRLKYLGLTFVLVWHYCLWFVPNTFPSTFLLDDRVTTGWLVALASAVLTVLALAIALGRAKHLPRSPALIWTASGAGCAATLVLTLGAGVTWPPGTAHAGSAVIGISAGFLWIMWGERYACQRARFTMGRIAPTYGVTLLAGLALTSVLPGALAPAFVAVLPLVSGLLLQVSWRRAPVKAFPPVLPRQTARYGVLSIVVVCTVALVAALVSYFVVAIVPWSSLVLGVDRSFTLGVAIGAVFILGIGLFQSAVPAHPTVFRLFPWLVFLSIIACLLCVVGVELDFGAFLLALAVSSIFEVLLIMYMARLTLSGYIPSATAFGLSGGAIRFGICLGNGLALVYERHPGAQDDWTSTTLVVFVAVLAALLILVVRREYTINDLARSPHDRTQWETVIAQVGEQFRLSAREREIAAMLGLGYTASAIAQKLVISPHTVNTHVQHIYEKMGIHRRCELLDYMNQR